MVLDLKELEKEFRRMNHAYRHTMRCVMSRYGLYYGQPAILFMLLAHDGGCTQKKISEHRGISQATVAVSIRRLLKAGFVTKTPDKNDLRRNRIELTELGRETIVKCRKEIDLIFEKMIRGFSSEEMDRLADYFQRINDNLCG